MNPLSSPTPQATSAAPRSAHTSSRVGRRHLLSALPAGALLAGAGPVAADPGKGKGKGKGRGKNQPFRLGLENLLADPSILAGANVGLITNPTGTDAQLRSGIDLLADIQEGAGFHLVALYGPEHGVRGAAPAGDHVEDYEDAKTGLPVRSLYGETQKPTPEMIADVDTLVFDIQDIGARFYTYIWTMYYAMEAAAENGKRFIVLDRPNPLGADAEGFVLEPALSSFIGLKEIPQRHGLTVGELARLFNAEFLAQPADLHVVEMTGYDPENPPVDALPWIPPSPNIPTAETAVVYAGTGLIEALNVSEGRGTTVPFLWFGAPFITEEHIDAIIADLHGAKLPGLIARPMFATPTTSKHEGEFCGGIQLHLTDVDAYEPVRTGIHVIAALLRHVDDVDWREGEKCRTEQDVCWIDRTTGTKRTRQMLEAGDEPDAIVNAWKQELGRFTRLARQYRLY